MTVSLAEHVAVAPVVAPPAAGEIAAPAPVREPRKTGGPVKVASFVMEDSGFSQNGCLLVTNPKKSHERGQHG